MLGLLALGLTEATRAGDASASTSPLAADAARSRLSAVVAGIVAYTRWPSEAATIRLCTLGQGPGVDELLRATDLGASQRPVTVQALNAADAAGGPCDAVYVGTSGGATGREVLRRLAGRPVLLLGEGPEFCSDGGMFCLASAGGVVRFNTNLDAIARSGLRINPLVLRIARGTAAGGS